MTTEDIFLYIEKEKNRQKKGLELIASENFVSPDVMKASGSILTNKYAEGYPGRRYYGGCEHVDEVEKIAIERVKKIFGATWANVQPHSGSQANAAVMMALLNPGDKILGFDLSHGGHLTHGFHLSFSGKLYKPFFYGVNKETETIDYKILGDIAHREKPKLIICGASAYSRDWDYKKFREIADSVGAYLMGDIAHTAGLIASKLLNNPIKYCHILTSTTHKTLRGPRGGIIFGGEDFEVKNSKGKTSKISDIINISLFPGIQGGPLMHTIAAKAVAFGEILNPKFETYSKQVIKNSKTLANHFINRGYRVVSGGTDNHLFLLDLSNKNITGKESENILDKINITVNKNMIPFDTKPPLVCSGIRIGTAAITTRGLLENHMEKICEFIDDAISSNNNIPYLKNSVENFVKDFDMFYIF